MATLSLGEKSVIDTLQEHRKATIRTMLRHGDIHTEWTTETLAARIGLPEADLVAYIAHTPGAVNRVDSHIIRYLSVNIENWRGGA